MTAGGSFPDSCGGITQENPSFEEGAVLWISGQLPLGEPDGLPQALGLGVEEVHIKSLRKVLLLQVARDGGRSPVGNGAAGGLENQGLPQGG